MRPKELEPYFRFALDYPVDSTEVRDRLGLVEVTAPGGTDGTTLDELLAHAEGERYDSHTALYEAVMGLLDETHVGRKYYDDRGGAPPHGPGPTDDRNRSF
ncbi:hypothetical protein [Haloarchaeobius sp. HRN-SO-5]|uniref:DUF5789 family protein n=1 Tax=Haloarchaeobius sp. HRN-SO-5 TaxID=3446118 RepID=UPI003EBA3D1C